MKDQEHAAAVERYGIVGEYEQSRLMPVTDGDYVLFDDYRKLLDRLAVAEAERDKWKHRATWNELPSCEHCPWCHESDSNEHECTVEQLKQRIDHEGWCCREFEELCGEISKRDLDLMDRDKQLAASEKRAAELAAMLTDWQSFCHDVQASCAMGDEWLEGLRKRTKRILETEQQRGQVGT